MLNRHCERSEAIHECAHGLLRCARNDGVGQSNLISLYEAVPCPFTSA
jgi:hypothetical protein